MRKEHGNRPSGENLHPERLPPPHPPILPELNTSTVWQNVTILIELAHGAAVVVMTAANFFFFNDSNAASASHGPVEMLSFQRRRDKIFGSLRPAYAQFLWLRRISHSFFFQNIDRKTRLLLLFDLGPRNVGGRTRMRLVVVIAG